MYRVVLDGSPHLECEFSFREGDDHLAGGFNITAMRAVNAIPALCAAEAGVVSTFDLPPVTGRGRVAAFELHLSGTTGRATVRATQTWSDQKGWTMDLGIAGKVVFFTGGSKGMGRDAAHMLAAEGCQVAIVARTKTPIDETVGSITDAGGTAMGVTADITNADDVDRAVSEVTTAFGPPLIVIGQTKFNIPGDFADVTEPERYVDSFRSYTMSQIYLLHAVLPGMKEAGWGRFVHIGSATAKEPEGAIHHAIANATRPSTTGLLKTVADEYARFGITVNTVAPGWIGTQNAYDYLEQQVGLAPTRRSATGCASARACRPPGWAVPTRSRR